MKRITFLFMCLALIVVIDISCTKQSVLEPVEGSKNELLDIETAQKEFARILSKAVAENEQLRVFIKKEALKQFDNDYDVFYPYVKDEVIDDDKTFRELLINISSKELVSQIEQSLPKLTILVPDYSWISEKCFSINNWNDLETEVAVGIDEADTKEHTLFCNGVTIGKMPAQAYPTFPVLIIKENERILTTHSTKSGNVAYKFADLCFNGTKTKVKTWEGDFYNPDPKRNVVSIDGDYITESELRVLSPDVISAYQEFGLCYGEGTHRDLIYYGMNKDSEQGVYNSRRKEMLYRFFISREDLFSSADDAISDPYGINDTYWTGRDDRPGFEVCDRIWGGGKYEVKIHFFAKDLGKEAIELTPMVFSIEPGDLMYVNKIHDVFKWNIFGNNWSAYTINPLDVDPKWYYPGEHDKFMCIEYPWTLSEKASNLIVFAEEVDSGASYVKEIVGTFKHSFKTTVSVSVSSGNETLKTSLSSSAENENEKTETQKLTISWTDKTDDLGSCEINYIDNVVTNKTSNRYALKRYDTGKIGLTILPIDVRNEYTIRSYMNNRASN